MTMRRAMNMLLAILLMAILAFVCYFTVKIYYEDLGYSLLVTYRQKLPNNPSPLDNLKARVDMFTSTWDTDMVTKPTLRKLNARFQRAIGKDMITFGSTMTVTTNTGDLYDLKPDTPQTQQVRTQTLSGLKAIKDALDIPVLYGYAHTTLYDGVTMPDGVTDDNDAVADEIVGTLRSYGIEVIDSRDIMRESGLPIDEIIYRTDAHWSARSAFEMYAQMVDLLNEKTAIKADRSAADIGRFNIETLPAVHMGDIGARFGPELVRPDDFQLITPSYDTNIHREITVNKQLVPLDGRFEDVVLEPKLLPAAKGLTYGNYYNYYGTHPDAVYYHNEAAPEGRLLVVKDSFGTPTSSFLALSVRDVCAVDLRKTTKTVLDFVDEFKPDAVMFVQCQEVMRGQNFVMVN